MKTFMSVIATVLISMAWLSVANALVIDDFNTGSVKGNYISSGDKPYFSTGSMIGGARHVKHIAGPFSSGLGREGVINITEGHLILEDGVYVGSRVEVTYGINEQGKVTPLNLDLSRTLSKGKFTLHFHSLDMTNQVDAVIQMTTPSRESFQISKSITPPVAGTFTVDFSVADFRSNSSGNAPTANDLKSIEYIMLIIQEAGNGGSDYAIDSFDITF